MDIPSQCGSGCAPQSDVRKCVSASYAETMLDHRNFYIDGEWITPSIEHAHHVINPATEEPIAMITLGSPEDVNRAVTAAKRAFESYSQTSIHERLDWLRQIIDLYQEKSQEMAEIISLEMGAPVSLARKAQVPAGLAHFLEVVKVLEQFRFEELKGTTLMRKEPIGVCGLITPWNWPMNQIACKVAPALAAGCTMILKPSELAPLSAHLLAEIIHGSDLPPGVFNLVDGDGPTVGAAIASHPEVDMVSFTGSARAGVAVAVAAAPTVKRVTQELGGKSANVILDDADLETAVRDGVRACFRNTGQSCNAPTRMLVPRRRILDAENVAREAAESMPAGDPKCDQTDLGPLSNKLQYEKVQSYIRRGIDEGAKLISGGLGRPHGIDRGFFVRPTVFSNVCNNMTIAREEIFGPVLCIIPYDHDDEAAQITNDSPYGLAGFVTSGNLDRARLFAKRIRAGNVHINGARVDFGGCFGGYKQSGNGREWGEAGLEEFLELKAIFGYQPLT